MTESPLGKTSTYTSQYSPELLFPISREEKRGELAQQYMKFKGEDIWNAYEVSWLNSHGLPQVAIAEFWIPASSPNIVESKSFKLYLNSLNQTSYENLDQVQAILTKDVSGAVGAEVRVNLYSSHSFPHFQVKELTGELLDDLPVTIETYHYAPEILLGSSDQEAFVTETLISHLLKSNCLITSQPDWASIQIRYSGPKIEREKLLKYLISFRSHDEFHEQCVERIFCDLKEHCKPKKLTVYARYTRRGGLDINPWRSDFETINKNVRLARQ